MIGRVIEFQTVTEEDGSLTFFEGHKEIPFEIKRIFYIYDVPEGKQRADHASTTTDFVLIAVSGTARVELDDGYEKIVYDLTNKSQGLFIPQYTWMKVMNFKNNATLLAVASTTYRESHYIEDYDVFKDYVMKNRLWRGE